MDTLSATGGDLIYSNDEERYNTVGMSFAGRLLIVTHVDRGDAIRIISARKASRQERKDYEDG